MGLTDAITRCRAGDRSAYREVVLACADRLVAVLFRILGNLEDARDVAQESFARAYANLDRFDLGKPFEPWLYRIARNLAYNHLEARGRRLEGRLPRAGDEALADVEGGDDPGRGALEAEREERVRRLLDALRPQYREVLTLRYLARLEYREIAERMGVPIGTVRTWLRRAKSESRALVSEDQEDPTDAL